MRTFFIFSLPRSRTAWLSVLLTYGDSCCFHEGLIESGGMSGLRRMFESSGKPVVGNSDCGNILFLDEIREFFPGARHVVIDRNPDDVRVSLESIGLGDDGIVQLSHDRLEDAKDGALVVPFDELDGEACKEIWEHCVGTEFDERRWEMLDGMNITIDLAKKVESMKRNKNRINRLLGGASWHGSLR